MRKFPLKKISKKYEKTRWEKRRATSKRKLVDEVVPTREKKYRKLTDSNEERKTKNNIEVVSEIRDSAAKKITAKKVSEKYKKMRNAKNKKTFLVDEEDLETIDYNELTREENLIEKESILAAANKVFDFGKFKKEQAEALKKLPLNESILAQVNNVFDFEKFKQQQAEAVKNFNDQLSVKKNNLKIAAKKISGKYRKLRNSRAVAAQKTQTKEELPVKKR